MKKIFYILILCIIAAGLFLQGSDQMSSYLSGHKNAKIKPGLLWKTSGLSLLYGPILGPGGNLYCSNENNVFCFSPSGSLLWQRTCGAYFQAHPFIGKDSNLYSVSPTSVVKFSPKGQEIWVCDIKKGENYNPEPIFTDSGIFLTKHYVGERRNLNKNFEIVFINSYGIEKPYIALGDKIKPSGLHQMSIVDLTDSSILVQFAQRLILLDSIGEIKWEREIQPHVTKYVLDSLHQNVFLASNDELRAYKIGGEQLWYKIFPGSRLEDLQLRFADELVVNNGNLSILGISTVDGHENWNVNPNENVDEYNAIFESKLLIDNNKDILLFYNKGYLARIVDNGKLAGNWPVAEAKFNASPVLSEDGKVYVLDQRYNLYAIALRKD